MHGLTRGEMLQMYYKDRSVVQYVHVPYQEKDLRYDTAQGYLQRGGGDQVVSWCTAPGTSGL